MPIAVPARPARKTSHPTRGADDREISRILDRMNTAVNYTPSLRSQSTGVIKPDVTHHDSRNDGGGGGGGGKSATANQQPSPRKPRPPLSRTIGMSEADDATADSAYRMDFKKFEGRELLESSAGSCTHGGVTGSPRKPANIYYNTAADGRVKGHVMGRSTEGWKSAKPAPSRGLFSPSLPSRDLLGQSGAKHMKPTETTYSATHGSLESVARPSTLAPRHASRAPLYVTTHRGDTLRFEQPPLRPSGEGSASDRREGKSNSVSLLRVPAAGANSGLRNASSLNDLSLDRTILHTWNEDAHRPTAEQGNSPRYRAQHFLPNRSLYLQLKRSGMRWE